MLTLQPHVCAICRNSLKLARGFSIQPNTSVCANCAPLHTRARSMKWLSRANWLASISNKCCSTAGSWFRVVMREDSTWLGWRFNRASSSSLLLKVMPMGAACTALVSVGAPHGSPSTMPDQQFSDTPWRFGARPPYLTLTTAAQVRRARQMPSAALATDDRVPPPRTVPRSAR